MNRHSKEGAVLRLFFDEPARQWHFEEMLKEAGLSRKQLARWLCIFSKKRLIRWVKPRNRMPYYVADCLHPEYQTSKRVYALQKMQECGLLNHLVSLPKAKAVIIFGSMTRWDWHKESDLDIFVYGDAIGLEAGKFERRLDRDIQVFECRDIAGVSKLGDGLLRNILKGDFVKGSPDFIKVVANG